MAPLQRRAWYSLVLGIACALGIAAVFVAGGGVTAYVRTRG
ncbi:MAG: hypothetical protein SVP26_09810 [Chloroflexota bacterium]|nr:hypothetical protein [Chloroflexota bacterium]